MTFKSYDFPVTFLCYYWGSTLFCIHCLAGCDCHHLIDVINRASAAQVVDRTGDTLKDRSYRIGISKSLYKLVCNVADFQIREYQNVCLSCNLRTRSFLASHSRNAGGICLKFSVYAEARIKLFCKGSSLDHLVNDLVLG